MIVVLGDLIVDLALHIDGFPVNAADLKRVDYLEAGPGGSTNVAITAARLGLQVGCLGEVGDDEYGRLVVDGLRAEGIATSGLLMISESRTPVAFVIVDANTEPAYLGYRGTLTIDTLEDRWRDHIKEADALFVDGWADHQGVETIALEGLQAAKEAGVPRFFDPGPGNHEFSTAWHLEAASLASVVLLNAQEAERLVGLTGVRAAAEKILELGPELVIIKLGEQGCYIRTTDEQFEQPGYAVQAADTTGAGDSFNAAVIFGYLRGLTPAKIAEIANATGAAKALKRGTGHNMPTVAEIRDVVEREGSDLSGWPPELVEDANQT